jgi:hypothetical protein
VISLVGNKYHRHRGLVWSHVPPNRYRAAAETVDGESWERFLCETQLKQAAPTGNSVASLFKPGARVQIFDHAGVKVGQDFAGVGLSGWFMQGLADLQTRKSFEGSAAWWRVDVPELISDG